MESMRHLTEETVKKLNDLVRVNIDSAEGFATAANQIDNPRIAALFASLSQQRRLFAEQLRCFVEMNDEAARDAGSIQGDLHRWWLNLRAAVSGGDGYAVLAEAERGEDVIKKRYEEALEQTTGSAVHETIQRQYADVKQAHDHVRDLRDLKKAE